MSKLVNEVQQQIREAIISAIGRAVSNTELPCEAIPDFNIEVPSDSKNGDYSSNVAMVSARAFKSAPRKIAEVISSHLLFDGTFIEKCEIAGPGFLNFFLDNSYYAAILKDIIACGKDYGRSDYGKGKKINVEFVSANPTGPMHMGNARGGALGDCLAAIMDYAG